ncbi:MAG: Spx/MgsR family RNA polymerase-binding regulatory protein [Bavariicoccus seileri]|uniref:Spx/MgsR family RNA polymerase-binding regulatory protein n=1 Tax=Bavariicoccus seileri TaxID=549685 RepID=UPI0003B51CC5|nr:Spx/MgsR family RNA polymerase-binding regulatory protein [Bavariicoccus seileri]
MTTFVGYPNCSTSKRIEKEVTAKGIPFEYRNIKTENPTVAELKQWRKLSGLPLKRFFNTSGTVYRELGLKDKLKQMSEEEQYQLLATNGMLVKRPILVMTDKVFVGNDIEKML